MVGDLLGEDEGEEGKEVGELHFFMVLESGMEVYDGKCDVEGSGGGRVWELVV